MYVLADSTPVAIWQLIVSSVVIVAKIIAHVAGALFDILFFGTFSVSGGFVDDSLLGRLKAVGCDAACISLIPLGAVLDIINDVAELFVPGKVLPTHVLAAHVWTGFVLAKILDKTS